MTAVLPDHIPALAMPPAGASPYSKKLFHRAHYAVQSKRAKQGKPGAAEAAAHHRHEMTAAAIEQYVTESVEKFPPFTADQRAKLMDLLKPAREYLRGVAAASGG